MAIDEGLIGSVDDLELAARNPRFREITLRDLLTMSSGIRYEEGGFPSFGDDTYTYYGVDLRAVANPGWWVVRAVGAPPSSRRPRL